MKAPLVPRLEPTNTEGNNTREGGGGQEEQEATATDIPLKYHRRIKQQMNKTNTINIPKAPWGVHEHTEVRTGREQKQSCWADSIITALGNHEKNTIIHDETSTIQWMERSREPMLTKQIMASIYVRQHGVHQTTKCSSL